MAGEQKKKPWLLKFINFWPPYFGAGIRVKRVSSDFREIEVEMKQRFWNTNYVGVHFGGSLYAMTDPFFMLMLMQNLGDEYIVWDKAATVRFKRPGKGRVTANFKLSEDQIASVKQKADSEPKVEPVFSVQVIDEGGGVVAEVDKVLHVKRKHG